MATEIQYQSQLPALIQSLTGSVKKDSGGTSTSTSSSSANIDPLTQVFSQAMGNSNMSPEMMQALIGSIFTEGAAQVPVLTQAYANATGSRSSNNSGLALALNDLNKSLSTQAVSAMLQNNTQNTQIANNAAGNIAQATQSKTSTTTNPQTTQKVQPNYAALALMAGGSVLNGLDKKFGLSDKLGKSIFGDSSAPAAVDTVPALSIPSTPTLGGFSGPISLDSSMAGMAPMIGSSASGGGIPGFDTGSAWDGASSALSGFNWNTGDTSGFSIPDGAGSLMDWATTGLDGGVDLGGFDWNTWGNGVSLDPTGLAGAGGSLFDNFSWFADGGQPDNIFARRAAAIQEAANASAMTGADTNAVYQQTMAQPAVLPATPASAPSMSGPRTTIQPNGMRDLIRRRLGFADGGRLMSAALTGPMPNAHINAFADGGITRNRNNMGTAAPRQLQAAYSVNGDPTQAMMAATQPVAPVPVQSSAPPASAAPKRAVMPSQMDDTEAGAAPGGNPSAGGGGLGLDNTTMGMISLGSTLAGMPGLGTIASVANSKNPAEVIQNMVIAGISMVNPIAGIAAKIAQSIMGKNTISNAITASNESDVDTSAPPEGRVDILPLIQEEEAAGDVDAGAATASGGATGGGAFSDPEDAIGMGSNDNGGETDGGVGGASGGASGATGGGTASDGGDFSDGGSLQGGLIRGPGNGTSDSIRVNSREPGGPKFNVSADEFIMPADVVRHYGVNTLQRMVDAVHTPVNR